MARTQGGADVRGGEGRERERERERERLRRRRRRRRRRRGEREREGKDLEALKIYQISAAKSRKEKFEPRTPVLRLQRRFL